MKVHLSLTRTDDRFGSIDVDVELESYEASRDDLLAEAHTKVVELLALAVDWEHGDHEPKPAAGLPTPRRKKKGGKA